MSLLSKEVAPMSFISFFFFLSSQITQSLMLLKFNKYSEVYWIEKVQLKSATNDKKKNKTPRLFIEYYLATNWRETNQWEKKKDIHWCFQEDRTSWKQRVNDLGRFGGGIELKILLTLLSAIRSHTFYCILQMSMFPWIRQKKNRHHRKHHRWKHHRRKHHRRKWKRRHLSNLL